MMLLLGPTACQGSSAPFAFLSAPGAGSGQTSVHAIEEPRSPLAKLSADARGGSRTSVRTEGW
jgi:hypothetical protein